MREVEREGGHHCSVVYMWVHFDYALRTLLYYLVHNYTANHSFLVQIMHMLNAHLIGCSFSPNSYVYSGFVYDRSTSPCSTGFYLHIFILYFCTSWKREGKIQFCLFCSSGGTPRSLLERSHGACIWDCCHDGRWQGSCRDEARVSVCVCVLFT